MFIVSFLHW